MSLLWLVHRCGLINAFCLGFIPKLRREFKQTNEEDTTSSIQRAFGLDGILQTGST